MPTFSRNIVTYALAGIHFTGALRSLIIKIPCVNFGKHFYGCFCTSYRAHWLRLAFYESVNRNKLESPQRDGV